MNTIQRPPVEPTNGQGPSEPYEEMLRRFFRSELPNPWPALELPERSVLTIPRARPVSGGWFARSKSRLALAASLVILLLGSWLLSGAFRDGKSATPPGVNSKDDTAKPVVPPKKFPEKGR